MFRRAMFAAGALVTLGAAPTPYGSGLSFLIKTTTGSSTTAASATKVQFLDGVLRFDADSTKQSGKNSYVLVNTPKKSVTVVMPDSRQYIEINFADTTGQALGAMAQMMAATTVVSDIQVSGSALGSGGVVNGYPTSRYRITTSYSEVASGSEKQRKIRSIEEFWVTNKLKDIPDPMEAFTRAFGGQGGMPSMGGTVSDLMRKRGDAQRKLFKGLPIKAVTRTTTTERDGTAREDTTSTEILDLKRVNLDASLFQLPAGYTKLDMKAMMNIGNQMRNALKGVGKPGGMPAGSGDSTSMADDVAAAAKAQAQQAVDSTKQGAKDAAKNAAKDAAKDKAKCALTGLFGRKKC
ncbi:MAG: DUF4412 domain-containing protein [Gemmatimonadota bacterium]|nr:DUF4412 domain-containing protein [Gemmatimonadota bacterium]